MSDEKIENTPVHKCTVKWFRNSLGYGFLTKVDGDDKGKDIFVHHSGIKPARSQYKTLQQGEYVECNIVPGENGQQAVNVTGLCNGALMCDYWHDKRQQNHKKNKKSELNNSEHSNNQSEIVNQQEN